MPDLLERLTSRLVDRYALDSLQIPLSDRCTSPPQLYWTA